ncbi:MAG: efflux transporter outer membrane subunit [Caulobacteraceae bacterium]
MAGDAASKVPALGASAENLRRLVDRARLGRPRPHDPAGPGRQPDPGRRRRHPAAGARGRRRRAAERPRAVFNASAERTRINLAAFGIPGFPSPTVNQYSVGGNIAYDLDLFGGLRRATEDAQARAEAEGHRAKAAYLTLTGNVAMAAVRIATLRAQIAAIQSVIDEDAKDHRLHQEGPGRRRRGPPPPMVSARGQMVQDQALLPDLRQQLAEARHGLALLVGHAPADWTAPDFDLAALTLPASIPAELPSELVRRRPDILAAEADLHAAVANIGVQTARLYPDVKLSAAFAQTSLEPEKLFQYEFSGWNFGPSLSVPIFGRGQLKARIRVAEAAAKVANARYQQTVITAFTQVSDVLSALANDEAAVAAQDQARQVAEQDLKNTEFAYQKGGGALPEVTQSQRRLSETRQAYALAQGKRYADAIRLYIATAADWRAPVRTAAN